MEKCVGVTGQLFMLKLNNHTTLTRLVVNQINLFAINYLNQ